MSEDEFVNNICVSRVEEFLKKAEAEPSMGRKELSLKVEWSQRRGRPQIRCYAPTERSVGLMLESELPIDLGGEATRPTPFQYFLFSLAASYLSIFMILASRKGIKFGKASLKIKSDIDYLRILKVDEEVEGLGEMEMELNVESEASDEDLLKLLEEAKNRCPVFSPIKVKVVLKRAE